jgi:AraC-like DNA-binding protein
MPELTVAAGLARALIDYAATKGVPREKLLARSAINADDLADQDNRIPFAKYEALMRAAKELSADPAFALHFGNETDLAQFSVVGLIGRASMTMGDAFLQLTRYGRLVIDLDLGPEPRFKLAPGDGGLWMIDTRPNPNDFIELTESTLARTICGCTRMIVDSGWKGETPAPLTVHVTHADPGYGAEYERVLDARVVFGSDKNAFLVDPKWVGHRLSLEPRYVFGILTAHADALLESLANTKTIRGQVESLLLPILHTGEVGIDTITDRMQISRWTLSRKLKAEGVTFEQILDELRHKMALHYLNGKKVSVNETAYLVGFSEPAAFSRAFKRWTGVSPRAMRMAKTEER